MQTYNLVGNPIGHLLSPPVHETVYEETGLDVRYVTFEPTRGGIAAAVEDTDTLGISGLNVTIPFKQDVLELVDSDPLVKRVGTVNTTDFGGEAPKGCGTDAAGITRFFKHHGVGLVRNSAAVVGADGAGQATAFALVDADVSVHIASRTAEAVVELAAAAPGVIGDGLDTLDRIREVDALISTTSVEMESPDETPVSAEYLHGDLAVLDAVHTPPGTWLLREAAVTGAIAIDGVWMLLLQNVEAFERWTGRDTSVDATNAALRGHLEND